jgi:GT2 family glycosyltransferase
MRVAVITIAAGRPRHLARQSAALARSADGHRHHVVAMGDAAERARCAAACAPGTDVIAVPREPDGLPLARARNAGARRALEGGAELLVFLDVDCLPAPKLLARYRAAARVAPGALLCGPVGYLPPLPLDDPLADDARLAALARPHPARPIPPDGVLWHGGDHRLLWTLSFAVTDMVWNAIGGFCEDYVGYGGEDTDFGQLARAAGVDLCWVGGAWAHHQHHPTHDPPIQHREAILRNAALFHRRWGWWPMEGWLDAFGVPRDTRALGAGHAVAGQ